MNPATNPEQISYADVMVPRSGKKALFTYVVPENLQTDLRVGHVVTVPLGKRSVHAVVWTLNVSRPHFKVTLKPIKKIVHTDLKLLPYQRELALWMTDQFMAPLPDCVFSFLPILKSPPKEDKEAIKELPHPTPLPKGEGEKQADLLLNPSPPRGEGDRRSGEESSSSRDGKSLRLNSEQQEALAVIKKSTKPVLLHGVTGSGKTEIYLQYAHELLQQGKQVLILVPEIALTPQTKKRFEERFGDAVAVWHSDLGMAERRSIWWQIQRGVKQLVVGSRSAIFLPYADLGLIAIDEEHEKTFYQESSPRYDARLLAEFLHQKQGTKLVLGSATPALESVWKASNGTYDLAQIQSRVSDGKMPQAVIVDLRQEHLEEGSFISGPLFDELVSALKNKRQAVLLLNRRGHSTVATCTACGTILLCKNCNVPLTVHFVNQGTRPLLICHHCDHRESAPDVCPVCKTPNLRFSGFGTEKVEAEIRRLLPTARILRMDRDTTSTRSVIDQMYHDFAAHKYDILLGTQMIAKGWDIPKVDVVGVLLAEGGLMLPDYHAAANTFNLLVQVSGRSGRGEKQGKTIIQTYQPDHVLIRTAALHDFGTFAKQELKFRQAFHYPPFSTIIRLLYQHKSDADCKSETNKLAKGLREQLHEGDVEILGPAPCFFERLRGKYRYHIILKVKNKAVIPKIRDIALDLKSPWVTEVDPPQLL